MAMEARLSLRQSQRVVMTPLLQQAIQLLQLSTLELQEVVQKELLENPLLEEVPTETPETPEAPAPGETPAPTAPTTAETQPLEPPPVDRERGTDDLPFDLTAVMFDDHEERSLVAQEDRDELPFENMVRSQSSLTDHLDEQLRFAVEDPAVRRIGNEIIGNLDEDGYLRAEVSEIAARCQTTVEDVEKVLALVQAFDPPGVAARSIQECLLIQLKSDPNPDPVSVEIVEQYFDDLTKRRYPDIARALKLSLDRVMESVEEIMSLEPKPGRRFGGSDSRYIVPDVVVHKMGNEYVVVLNEDGIPRLRVNSLYRSLLRNSGDEARAYVEQKLRSAVWLIKSVDQRQRTLRKVTQSIVKFQREFLDKGLPYLRPLSLRDVGEDIGMHESTISRVTTNKYVETPQGLFELKYFFHSGIASGTGEMVSSVSVKKMIQDLLANEDPSKPLSDQEVAQILKGRGLVIARRTVAKYREELGILPSHQRRLAAIGELRARGHKVEILFLEPSDEALVRRYHETRRRHPLSGEGHVHDAIRAERKALAHMREVADRIIDTSSLTVHQFKELLGDLHGTPRTRPGLATSLVSFGFRHGIPIDADLVFDVRFLPNPHFVEGLRPLDGRDARVREYILSHGLSRDLLERLQDLLRFLLPAYQREGKAYLTVAIGCTGGRHRSVAFVEELRGFMESQGFTPTVVHRDLDRE